MASTVIEPVADQLKTLLEALAVTPAVKAYRWAPRDLDSLPAAVIDLPTVERTEVGAQETEMGHDDWSLTIPVSLYFDLNEATQAQQQAVEVFEAFVAAVDADSDLSGLVDEARVIRGEPELIADEARPMLAIRCTVDALKLVA